MLKKKLWIFLAQINSHSAQADLNPQLSPSKLLWKLALARPLTLKTLLILLIAD